MRRAPAAANLPACRRLRAASLLAALAALGACAAEAALPAAEDASLPAIEARASLVGQHVRAALACGLPLSTPAQDRAAAIEAAALRIHQARGGAPARDAWLAGLAPPAFDPRRQGRDRAAWCAARRPDIERVGRWLDGPEGAAFAGRATGAAVLPPPVPRS